MDIGSELTNRQSYALRWKKTIGSSCSSTELLSFWIEASENHFIELYTTILLLTIFIFYSKACFVMYIWTLPAGIGWLLVSWGWGWVRWGMVRGGQSSTGQSQSGNKNFHVGTFVLWMFLKLFYWIEKQVCESTGELSRKLRCFYIWSMASDASCR